jgi:hypothetical protein
LRLERRIRLSGFERLEDVLIELNTSSEMARLGLEDFLRGDRPKRRAAGLRNVIVWGRSVTFVLQNIRTFKRDTFDSWYGHIERKWSRTRASSI